MALLVLENVVKSFRSPDGDRHTVLDIPGFSLKAGEQVALAGSSGSGKTTLLNVIAGILRPDSGKVIIDGTEVSALTESRRDRFRANNLGYVFQSFQLLQGHSALENVLLGMAFGGGADRRVAEELLRRLGMGERLHHLPRQLSIGQQQRVAVARALAHKPRLVLADEPTGNLDHANAGTAMELLCEACVAQGASLLVVSHDPQVLARFRRRVELSHLNHAGVAGVGR